MKVWMVVLAWGPWLIPNEVRETFKVTGVVTVLLMILQVCPCWCEACYFKCQVSLHRFVFNKRSVGSTHSSHGNLSQASITSYDVLSGDEADNVMHRPQFSERRSNSSTDIQGTGSVFGSFRDADDFFLITFIVLFDLLLLGGKNIFIPMSLIHSNYLPCVSMNRLDKSN